MTIIKFGVFIPKRTGKFGLDLTVRRLIEPGSFNLYFEQYLVECR